MVLVFCQNNSLASNSAGMESRPNCYNCTYDICPLRFRLGSAAISVRGKNDPSASDGLREIKTSESPHRILKSVKWNQSITSLMCCFWDRSHFFMWLDWNPFVLRSYISPEQNQKSSALGDQGKDYNTCPEPLALLIRLGKFARQSLQLFSAEWSLIQPLTTGKER